MRHFKFYTIFLMLLIQKPFYHADFSEEHVSYYLSSWIVKISGSYETMKRISDVEGFHIVEQIAELPNVYILRYSDQSEKEEFKNATVFTRLASYKEVIWLEQEAMVTGMSNSLAKTSSFLCAGSVDVSIPISESPLFNDPNYPKQWFLRTCPGLEQTYDIGVFEVWKLFQIFGAGVVVMIVDDGLSIHHEDLQHSYNRYFGLDLWKTGSDPIPPNTGESHGTRCAGIIAMRPNNSVCGVGIAPSVTLGAVRLYQNLRYTSTNQAIALTFKTEEVDIVLNPYNFDDGIFFSAMNELLRSAIEFGITVGRRGKGVIYVYPAGNGKANGDMCGCDPFVNSIYTIAVAGVTHTGHVTSFSELCSAIMVTAYSGDGATHDVTTTDTGGSTYCTDKFFGTSASAPIVAGCIALVLEANRNLTWRDVQHIIVWTSEYKHLTSEWQKNKAGLYVSHDFGFGLINAYKMVVLAKFFEPVPPMHTCVVTYKLDASTSFITKEAGGRLLSISVDGCASQINEINYVEHVQLQVDLRYKVRGNLQIALISPHETTSLLLVSRRKDNTASRIKNYVFDNVHMWGENPVGVWNVCFFDNNGSSSNHGKIYSVHLIIYGTKEKPAHYNPEWGKY